MTNEDIARTLGPVWQSRPMHNGIQSMLAHVEYATPGFEIPAAPARQVPVARPSRFIKRWLIRPWK